MDIEQQIRFALLALPRSVKRMIVILIDMAAIIVSVWLAYFLRVGVILPIMTQTAEHFPLMAVAAGVAVGIPLFLAYGLYSVVFRFADGAVFGVVGRAIVTYGVIYVLIVTVVGLPGVPRTIGFIQPAVLFALLSLSRYLAQYLLGGSLHSRLRQSKKKRVLIYGAGPAGRELAGLLSGSRDTKAVGFLEEDSALQGRQISGLPVFSPTDLLEVSATLSAHEVMLAIPDASRRHRNEVVRTLQGASLLVRTLPSYDDLIKGRVTFNDIRDLSIEDILGRDAIPCDPDLMSRDAFQKVVMVSGAGGSIGSELCRQIIRQKPSDLILFEQNEFALYSIQQELLKFQANTRHDVRCRIVATLGSVNDERVVRDTIRYHKVDTIYHAAAYKHVPLVEENSLEGVKNNVIGTQVIATQAHECEVGKFVLISTDKAVRPTSIMGASKRVAEMILQVLSNQNSKTSFAVVRFGNVLDSSGSVVPLFRNQIAGGGPLTVTHPDVTRYFMTIPEAAQLVIQAGAMTNTILTTQQVALVYLLNMGEPVKIIDLARKIIELSGMTVFDDETNPSGDIEIKIIGLRPGEKLYEELMIGDAKRHTEHPKIWIADEDCLSEETLKSLLADISDAIASSDADRLKDLLRYHFATLRIAA